MNDTANHSPQKPKRFPLIERWRTLLVKASRPLRFQAPVDPPPLWVTPGETPQNDDPVFPYCGMIRRVLSRYASILDIPMSFRIAASRYSPPAPSQAVHFHAFAIPNIPVLFGMWSRVPLVHLTLAHGIPLAESACRALEPGSQFRRGVPLLDGDEHFVGESLGTNLYCLFDLLGQEEAWVPVLLRRHLDLGLPRVLPALAPERGALAPDMKERLCLLRNETEALARACRLARRTVAREAYIQACRERLADEIRFLEAEIAILGEGVEEMARRIATDTRRLHEARRRLHIPHGGQDHLEVVEQELERVRALPDVRDAHHEDGRISLTTVPILAEHGGRSYCLGRFRIDLCFNGDIRIVNLTSRVGRFDHPHVHAGRPSLGGIREGVAKLLGEFQLAAAAEVLIDFLKTVNPVEWQLPILHWAEAGREVGHGVFATN